MAVAYAAVRRVPGRGVSGREPCINVVINLVSYVISADRPAG